MVLLGKLKSSLTKMGYKVFQLDGGMDGWMDRGWVEGKGDGQTNDTTDQG